MQKNKVVPIYIGIIMAIFAKSQLLDTQGNNNSHLCLEI